MNRTALFIDAGYLNNVLKEIPNQIIDYNKFSKLIGGVDLFRTYYYNSLPFVTNNPSKEDLLRIDQANFFYKTLKEIPNFEIRLGKLIKIYQGGKESYQQKQVDSLITIDLLNLSFKNKITKAIIITGDSDFVPLVEIVKKEGVQVHLFHGSSYSRELYEICDMRTKINYQLLQKCGKTLHKNKGCQK